MSQTLYLDFCLVLFCRFLRDARLKNKEARKPQYMENPINAFHFVSRMNTDWKLALDNINCEECIETKPSKGRLRHLHRSR